MQLLTTRFGAIEVAPDDVYELPDGLPGFPGLAQATLLGGGSIPGHEVAGEQHSLFWLQDLADGALAFMCIQPWVPFPDYDIELDEKALGIVDERDVCVLAIVTVRRGDGRVTMTANLRAPLVIDTAARRVHQVILTDAALPLDAPFAVSPPAEVV